MDAAEARDLVAGKVPREVTVDVDDLGHVIVHVRRDMLHLDADALNDRLHAWIARRVHAQLPHAMALVSFRNARPATLDDAELDVQDAWRDLEPTFQLDPAFATESEVRAFADLVPVFLRLVEASGRPDGWRVVDHGNAE